MNGADKPVTPSGTEDTPATPGWVEDSLDTILASLPLAAEKLAQRIWTAPMMPAVRAFCVPLKTVWA